MHPSPSLPPSPSLRPTINANDDADLSTAIPFLPHALQDDSEELLMKSAREMSLRIFSEWSSDHHIECQLCTDGITNKLVKVKNKSLPGVPPALLRCYGRQTHHLINRSQELRTLITLSSLGFAPPLFARFLNGFCYGFVEGRPLKPEELNAVLSKQDGQQENGNDHDQEQVDMAVLIAYEMARWHRMLAVKEEEDGDLNAASPHLHNHGSGKKRSHKSERKWIGCWQTIERWLQQVPAQYKSSEAQQKFLANQSLLNPTQLRHELATLHRWIQHDLHIHSPVVFCHNDLLAANIIYNPNGRTLLRTTPSNESTPPLNAQQQTSSSHAYCDSLNGFSLDSLATIDSTKPTTTSTDPNNMNGTNHHQQQQPPPYVNGSITTRPAVTFIDYEYGSYNHRAFDIANHFNEYAGFECDYTRFPDEAMQKRWLGAYWRAFYHRECTEQEMRKFLVEVAHYALVSHFLWGVWALVQAEVSTIDFDYMSYAILRLQEYRKQRKRLEELEQRRMDVEDDQSEL